MRKWVLMSTLAFCLPLMKQTASSIAGTWNVTATDTEDSTCTGETKGDVHAYLWLVSLDRDGAVLVTVQGTTGFPRLGGRWEPRTGWLKPSITCRRRFNSNRTTRFWTPSRRTVRWPACWRISWRCGPPLRSGPKAPAPCALWRCGLPPIPDAVDFNSK